MTKIASLPTIAGALLASGLSAVPADAANRTWVSGNGTDSGACTRAVPCRTFAFALTQTAAGGEIDVLDPAGYGPVTITKAISIVNDGVGTAGINVGSGNGVTINAAAGSVYLRGLTIEGRGGTNGILFNAGGSLEIENCVIRNFALAGIKIQSTPSSFSVSNTIASSNGHGLAIGVGISIVPLIGSAVVTGVLSKVTANNNGKYGIEAGASTTGALNVTIVDSVASNNILVDILAAGAGAVMVRNSVASNSGNGLAADRNAILRVAHSVVTGNINAANGNIFSYGDNDIDGNANNNTGALTLLAKH